MLSGTQVADVDRVFLEGRTIKLPSEATRRAGLKRQKFLPVDVDDVECPSVFLSSNPRSYFILEQCQHPREEWGI